MARQDSVEAVFLDDGDDDDEDSSLAARCEVSSSKSRMSRRVFLIILERGGDVLEVVRHSSRKTPDRADQLCMRTTATDVSVIDLPNAKKAATLSPAATKKNNTLAFV